jgi:hypothetical protein
MPNTNTRSNYPHCAITALFPGLSLLYKVPHIPHAIRLITLLGFHDAPPRPRKRTTTVSVTLLVPKQMRSRLAKNMPDSFIRGVQCLFITGKVVKHAFCYDEDVFRKVERGSDYKEGEDEEEYGICGLRQRLDLLNLGFDVCGTLGVVGGENEAEVEGKGEIGNVRRRWMGVVLKMNFSVPVNMYSEKVTSYWYRLRWSQRRSEDG